MTRPHFILQFSALWCAVSLASGAYFVIRNDEPVGQLARVAGRLHYQMALGLGSMTSEMLGRSGGFSPGMTLLTLLTWVIVLALVGSTVAAVWKPSRKMRLLSLLMVPLLFVVGIAFMFLVLVPMSD